MLGARLPIPHTFPWPDTTKGILGGNVVWFEKKLDVSKEFIACMVRVQE
jgi:hypothetical protein